MIPSTTLEKALEHIDDAASRATNAAKRIKKINIGQIVRQGDLYITRIKKVASSEPWLNRQLAIGSGRGARHVVNTDNVRLFVPSDNNVLSGPEIVADTEWSLTHPDHCDYVFPPGHYKTSYQLDSRTGNRVSD